MDLNSFTEFFPLVLIGAFVLDLAIGDPRWLPHPVVLMGKFIAWGERLLWSGKARRDLLAGALLSVALIVFSAGTAWGILGLFSFLPSPLAFIAIVGLASTSLAARGLLEAVSRIEAENTSDGIVAPLFYLALGGVPAAIAYKAVNTLDSMIGYRSDRYFYFGRFAARLDDCLNFIPARITAMLIVVAACLMRLHWIRALRVVRDDHANHLSPNAGYPEAAMAGVFGIRFGGPSSYFGQEVPKPYIGKDIVPIHMGMFQEAKWLCLITAVFSLATCLFLHGIIGGYFLRRIV
jgi:adenosylcobinamide-phosphate synthase